MPVDRTTSGLDLLVSLDGLGSRRQQVEAALRDAIRDGRLAPGTRVPSTRALARDLGVGRGTVVDAYAQLVAEGWLSARHGSGTVVAAETPADAAVVTASGSDPAPRLRFDLRPGRPDVSAFPRSAWLTALRRALRDAPDDVLSYGDPRGQLELRRELATYLGRARGVRTTPDRIVVCAGFVQGLALLAGVLSASGVRRIGIEAPCLRHHYEVVVAAGHGAVPMPVDDEGADVLSLASEHAGAVLVTPSHQHPMGSALSAERRSWLLDWARTSGALVIEDDYDGELRYDRAPLGALQGRDPSLVAYVGTASKTLAPGVRLGWLALPAHLVEPVAAAKQLLDRQSPVFDQLALAELLRSGGFDRHVRRMRVRYRARRDLLVAALSEAAPRVRMSGLSAGLQVLATLPDGGPSPAQVVAAASRRSLALASLDHHHWNGPQEFPPALIIGYGTPPEHAYRATIRELVATLASFPALRRAA